MGNQTCLGFSIPQIKALFESRVLGRDRIDAFQEISILGFEEDILRSLVEAKAVEEVHQLVVEFAFSSRQIGSTFCFAAQCYAESKEPEALEVLRAFYTKTDVPFRAWRRAREDFPDLDWR